MPTRCKRILLQILLLAQHVSGTTMPIIRSSRVLYSGCCLRYFMLWFSSCWPDVELRFMCPVCRMPLNITLSSTPDQHLYKHSTKYHRQQPLYNTLELLMMGIVVPETCWASNKICNKILLHLVGILFPHITCNVYIAKGVYIACLNNDMFRPFHRPSSGCSTCGSKSRC